ncbi:unnamed protein product, partial [Brenthis ino]
MNVWYPPDLPHECASIDETHAVARRRSATMRAAEGGTPGGLAPAEPQTGPDGEIIGGPRTPQQIAAQRRLQQTQAQVDEMMIIMGVIGIVIIGLLFVRYRGTPTMTGIPTVVAANATAAVTHNCKSDRVFFPVCYFAWHARAYEFAFNLVYSINYINSIIF